MRTGFVILAHERLDRAAQLARHLCASGGAVIVHLDTRIAPGPAQEFRKQIADHAAVISTRASEWGMFGLVAATLDAVRQLLADHDDLGHICLLSGACLPLRAPSDLSAHLRDHADTDFIESVPATETDWVQGGLSQERFMLWFPFAWRRQRWLFDRFVDLQRLVGVRRRIPDGLVPHIGLQWWCLTSATLRAILADPHLPQISTYFARCWIPDESFFQTLVRRHAKGRIHSASLTLQRFDRDGRPFVFHDDHKALLERTSHFFARKIDPDASQLYDHFLSGQRRIDRRFTSLIDETPFQRARQDRDVEGRGLASPARLPSGFSPVRADTIRPYLVLVSNDGACLEQVYGHLRDRSDLCVHGRLFAPEGTVFARPGAQYWGNLDGHPIQRDYRPAQFLSRLIWAERTRKSVFFFDPADNAKIGAQIVGDHNARLLLLGDAKTLVGRMRQPLPGKSRRRRARRLHPLWCWYRQIDTAQNTETMAETIGSVLPKNWSNPAGWVVPEDSKALIS